MRRVRARGGEGGKLEELLCAKYEVGRGGNPCAACTAHSTYEIRSRQEVAILHSHPLRKSRMVAERFFKCKVRQG